MLNDLLIIGGLFMAIVLTLHLIPRIVDYFRIQKTINKQVSETTKVKIGNVQERMEARGFTLLEGGKKNSWWRLK